MEILLDHTTLATRHPGDIISGRVITNTTKAQHDLHRLSISLVGFYGYASKKDFYKTDDDVLENMTIMFQQRSTIVSKPVTARTKDLTWSFAFDIPRSRPHESQDYELPPSGSWLPENGMSWPPLELERLQHRHYVFVCEVKYAIVVDYAYAADNDKRVLKWFTVRPKSDMVVDQQQRTLTFPPSNWPASHKFLMLRFVKNSDPIQLHGQIDLPAILSDSQSQPISISLWCTGLEQSREVTLQAVFIRLIEQVETMYGLSQQNDNGRVSIHLNQRLSISSSRCSAFLLQDFGLSSFNAAKDIPPTFQCNAPPLHKIFYILEIVAAVIDAHGEVVQLKAKQEIAICPES